MNKSLLKIYIVLFVLGTPKIVSQQKILYKQIDTIQLYLHHYPVKSKIESKKYPAMLFFFGGGWKTGKVAQFEPHATYFSQRGIECFLVEYRITSKHNSTPIESVKDAKSAIRFLKEHAHQYAIDTTQMIAAGGSAGGHLAAATALITSYNEETDNLSISCKPNGLVLFNPAIDNGPHGVGYDRMKEYYQQISPLHNITKNAPPTIIFQGTKDDLIPVETINNYQNLMLELGKRCDVFFYPNAKHGFFNYQNFENYKNTVLQADAFLQSLGFLQKLPIIPLK